MLGNIFGKKNPVEEIKKAWAHFRDYYEKALMSSKIEDPRLLQKKEIKDNLRKILFILAEEDRHLGPNENIGDCA